MVSNTTDEVGALGTAFVSMIASQRSLAGAANRLAAGDTSVEITPRSPRDVLGHAFVKLRGIMHALVKYLAAAETNVAIRRTFGC